MTSIKEILREAGRTAREKRRREKEELRQAGIKTREERRREKERFRQLVEEYKKKKL